MFVRIKKIKGNPYAYLVENRWTKKGPRQKTCSYLGRVEFLKPTNRAFSGMDYHEEGDLSPLDIVKWSIGYELARHGFNKIKRNLWKLEGRDILVDLARGKVIKKNSRIVLCMNNDFLCDVTLKKLLRFKSCKDRDGVAMDLAKSFVQAGIPIKEDIFVELFQLIYSPGQSFIHSKKTKKVIIVTGTPGTGKTTLAKGLVPLLKTKYLDVNSLVKENDGIVESFDNERDCFVVDEKKLIGILLDLIKRSKNSVVIDSHMSHYLPKSKVDCCIVTKCDIKVLKKRLEERQYSEAKIKENIESEIFEVCLQEAKENGHNVLVVNTENGIEINNIKEKILKLL